MKNLYFLLLFILFVQCEQPHNKISKSWKKTEEINTNTVFKDKNVNDAIEQAISIAKNIQIDITTISLVFAKENFYLYISSAAESCLTGNYYILPIIIQNTDYAILVDKNELVNQYIDTSNLNFVPLNLYKITICCEIKGYAFRFHKDEKEKYQLRELKHYYDYKDDFIIETDKKYFPIQYEEIPEPEPTK